MCYNRLVKFFKGKEDVTVPVSCPTAIANVLPVEASVEERLTEIERVLKGLDKILTQNGDILTETRDTTKAANDGIIWTMAGIKLTWYSLIFGAAFAVILFILNRIF